ncbi:hypothetical protein CYMTET_7876 [Cymbomonas tetramitiformis]|uniref:Uncharacterized protein n=1 Tax=Cymbomonas tetramitiformis TaxID=36881 RepID=A0AAE0LH22_9CHLO|nr:hypothetical protein CYMTET_7876 [Cymbomonas tetramitiformis]
MAVADKKNDPEVSSLTMQLMPSVSSGQKAALLGALVLLEHKFMERDGFCSCRYTPEAGCVKCHFTLCFCYLCGWILRFQGGCRGCQDTNCCGMPPSTLRVLLGSFMGRRHLATAGLTVLYLYSITTAHTTVLASWVKSPRGNIT